MSVRTYAEQVLGVHCAAGARRALCRLAQLPLRSPPAAAPALCLRVLSRTRCRVPNTGGFPLNVVAKGPQVKCNVVCRAGLPAGWGVSDSTGTAPNCMPRSGPAADHRGNRACLLFPDLPPQVSVTGGAPVVAQPLPGYEALLGLSTYPTVGSFRCPESIRCADGQ